MDLCGLPLGRPAFSMKKIEKDSGMLSSEPGGEVAWSPCRSSCLPSSPLLSPSSPPLPSFPSPAPCLTEPECRKLPASPLPCCPSRVSPLSPVRSKSLLAPLPFVLLLPPLKLGWFYQLGKGRSSQILAVGFLHFSHSVFRHSYTQKALRAYGWILLLECASGLDIGFGEHSIKQSEQVLGTS